MPVNNTTKKETFFDKKGFNLGIGPILGSTIDADFYLGIGAYWRLFKYNSRFNINLGAQFIYSLSVAETYIPKTDPGISKPGAEVDSDHKTTIDEQEIITIANNPPQYYFQFPILLNWVAIPIFGYYIGAGCMPTVDVTGYRSCPILIETGFGFRHGDVKLTGMYAEETMSFQLGYTYYF